MRSNYEFLMLLGCLLSRDIVARQDQQGVLNVIASFFYGKNVDQNKILSFDERLQFFEKECKKMPKSANFNEKIMALQTKGHTHQECVDICNLTKEYASQHKEQLSLQHFYQAYLCHQYKDYPDANKDIQYDEHAKLERAYHEASHAVITMMQNDNSQTALCFVSIKPYKISGGRFLTTPLLPKSNGNDEYFFTYALDRYMAGGVGEIVCKVPCQHRTDNDFEKVDKNHELYDYCDFITRCSTQGDIDIVCNLTNILLQLKYNNINYKSTVEERTQLVQESLKRVKLQVIEHKDNIEKLAHRLVDKETVYANEAYALCGKQRPKFYFEK